MQWINATVRNAAFAPAFFGSLVLTIAAAVLAVVLGIQPEPGLWLRPSFMLRRS
jgi:ABC-type phosphate transport system permease subunit